MQIRLTPAATQQRPSADEANLLFTLHGQTAVCQLCLREKRRSPSVRQVSPSGFIVRGTPAPALSVAAGLSAFLAAWESALTHGWMKSGLQSDTCSVPAFMSARL